MSLSGEAGYDALVWRLVDGGVRLTADSAGDLKLVDEAEFRERAGKVLAGLELGLSPGDAAGALNAAADDVYRYGPLTPLMTQPGVTDIVVNAPDRIFVDHGEGLRPADVRFRSAEHVFAFAAHHLSSVGKSVSRASPTADADLPDGSRLHVVAPPVSGSCVILAIRRFRAAMRMSELEASGMIRPADAASLRAAVAQRRNILIAGGPGAGKTTLLGALLGEADPAHRIVGVEDVPELRPHHPQYVRLLTRRSSNVGVVDTSVRDLVREALRMRPDRLIVGEVRGPEAFDMVSAMTTGMDGSMTTIHASSTATALQRLETLLQMASGSDQASALARTAIDLVVFIRRGEDGARIVEATERLR